MLLVGWVGSGGVGGGVWGGVWVGWGEGGGKGGSMYTRAGAGPVSLGLVTVLALLLTCRRGEGRQNIAHTHTPE